MDVLATYASHPNQFNNARSHDVQTDEHLLTGMYYENVEKNIEIAMENYKKSPSPEALFRIAYLSVVHPFQLGKEAFSFFHQCTENRYFGKMFLYFKPKADQGDADAACCVGILKSYEFGHHKAAIRFLRQSANQGNPFAQSRLGALLAKDKKYKEAVDYFMKSAGKNNPDAQFYLACAYVDGKGVIKKDDKIAFDYLMQSAGNGHVNALFALETMYRNGFYVETDVAIANAYRKERGGQEPSMEKDILAMFTPFLVPEIQFR